jgi:eukaryotic-like serine/threonine-protein kinase
MNLDKQRVGDYVLTEQLRQDKTGTLYRGAHAASAQQVVVEVLHDKYGKDPALVARFKRDAAVLRQIKHPSIVELVDHGESPQGLYLVMEGLTGESLAERLKREGRLSLTETQRIVAAVASALASAHRMRVVHRDLHADNVFLVGAPGEGEIKVQGLGLAKIVGDPAQGSPREVDQRADIRALGSLAYQMLSGAAPVPASSAAASSGNQRRRPAPLSTHGVTVPSSVEAAIMKALDRKKKRRFSSMGEFANAFGVPLVAPASPESETESESETEAEPLIVFSSVKPPPLPIEATRMPPLASQRGPERTNTLTGVVLVRAKEIGRTMMSKKPIVMGVAGAAAAVLAISWFAIRSAGPIDTVVNEVTPPPAPGKVISPPATPPAPPPAAPSRVDEILELNQKAVSAYAQSDVKTARALLENADKLAVASGYENAMVRAQTQVRLGALWIGGQKNPRVGRRYLAKAVAINPAVRLPASMMNPQVGKALHAVRAKARVASGPASKRALKAKHPKRAMHGRRPAI